MSASAYSTLAPMDALRAPLSAAQRAPGTRSPATTTATLTPTLAALENSGMSTNNVPGTLNWKQTKPWPLKLLNNINNKPQFIV